MISVGERLKWEGLVSIARMEARRSDRSSERDSREDWSSARAEMSSGDGVVVVEEERERMRR